MGNPIKPVVYPSRVVIIKHNRRVIEETRGFYSPPENLLQPDSLEWVLDAIQYPLYGIYLYPTFADKAAILAWTIINDHIFFDGNKRTGMFVMETFLFLNGYRLNATVSEVVNIALKIANNREIDFTYSDFVKWVQGKIVTGAMV